MAITESNGSRMKRPASNDEPSSDLRQGRDSSNKVARKGNNDGPTSSTTAQANGENPQQKENVIVIDGESDDEEEVTAVDGIHPMKPNVVGDSWIDPNRGLQFVLYLAVQEPTDSQYTQGLKKCRKLCDSRITDMCLQVDGTRHVTLAEGKLSIEQAKNIQFKCKIQESRHVKVEFDGFQPWKGGVYLKLSQATTANLKKLVDDAFKGGPYHKILKPKCDHLSLYRKRNAPNALYFPECAKLKSKLADHDWGTIQGLSIRIKQVGTSYDQCRVLWSV